MSQDLASASGFRGYIVCATPRSGSNFLCELLTSTGVLGAPREYFNAPGRRRYDNDPSYPEDPYEQLNRVRTTGRTANGVFGVKIHPFQVAAIGAFDPFAALANPHAVYLRRIDKLGQALSWARVKQTDQHRARDVAKNKPRYDAEMIRDADAFIAAQDAYWSESFKARGITPLEVIYEELHAEPQRQVDRVARLFDIHSAPIDIAKVTVNIQRDGATEEWRRRFLAETIHQPSHKRSD